MTSLVQTAIFFRSLFPFIMLQRDWSSLPVLEDPLLAPLSLSFSSLSAFCSSENLLNASMPIATRRLNENNKERYSREFLDLIANIGKACNYMAYLLHDDQVEDNIARDEVDQWSKAV